jgi:hypothetical protein
MATCIFAISLLEDLVGPDSFGEEEMEGAVFKNMCVLLQFIVYSVFEIA